MHIKMEMKSMLTEKCVGNINKGGLSVSSIFGFGEFRSKMKVMCIILCIFLVFLAA